MLVLMRRFLVRKNVLLLLFWTVFGGRSILGDFRWNLLNSELSGVESVGKCMDGSITSRPESQALPLFRVPKQNLYHFSGFFGRGAQFRDFFRL